MSNNVTNPTGFKPVNPRSGTNKNRFAPLAEGRLGKTKVAFEYQEVPVKNRRTKRNQNKKPGFVFPKGFSSKDVQYVPTKMAKNIKVVPQPRLELEPHQKKELERAYKELKSKEAVEAEKKQSEQPQIKDVVDPSVKEKVKKDLVKENQKKDENTKAKAKEEVAIQHGEEKQPKSGSLFLRIVTLGVYGRAQKVETSEKKAESGEETPPEVFEDKEAAKKEEVQQETPKAEEKKTPQKEEAQKPVEQKKASRGWFSWGRKSEPAQPKAEEVKTEEKKEAEKAEASGTEGDTETETVATAEEAPKAETETSEGTKEAEEVQEQEELTVENKKAQEQQPQDTRSRFVRWTPLRLFIKNKAEKVEEPSQVPKETENINKEINSHYETYTVTEETAKPAEVLETEEAKA